MGDIADWHEDQYLEWLFGPDFDGDEERFVRVWDGRKADPAEDFPEPPPEWPPAK